MNWTDSHNHLQDSRLGDPGALIDSIKQVGVARAIVNSTHEPDWQCVAELSVKFPESISPAFGIHPWYAHTALPEWQSRLTALLERFPYASIGECGLDQWVKTPVIDLQYPIFLEQLRIAKRLNRPITIHCLKAWGKLLAAFEEAAPPPKFLLHSFSGSIEMAQRLVPLGAYFSFSGYFLHERKASVREVFRQLPRERILLETDAPSMLPPPNWIQFPLQEDLNHPANLASIGNGLAAMLDMSPEALAELTTVNARSCFGI